MPSWRVPASSTRRSLAGFDSTLATVPRVVPARSTAEPGGLVEGTMTVNEVSRPFQFSVEGFAPRRYRGKAVLRQTDFGIKPYNGFFGALKLQDEVTVEFEITIPEP